MANFIFSHFYLGLASVIENSKTHICKSTDKILSVSIRMPENYQKKKKKKKKKKIQRFNHYGHFR